eukprot:scaffold1209_cov30-Phaeocystis_antarctica.AAC.1
MFEEPTGLGAAPAAPSAPSMAPTASSSSWPERMNAPPPRSSTAAVAVPVAKPVGFRWAAALADRLGGKLPPAKRTSSSSESATSPTYSCHPSCSSDDSGPEPGNAARPAPPPTRAALFGAPAAPPTAATVQFAAPPPLPADLAQMFDEPIDVEAAPATPPVASAAPTVSSSSWLKQQQLAEALEEQLTGVEAIE